MKADGYPKMDLPFSPRSQPGVLVTAAVIRRDEGILLVRRRPGQKLAGYWEFPGGKVESGETLAACLQREMLEELGVEVAVGAVVASSDYVYAHGAIHLVAMETTIVAGELQLTVHDSLAWVEASRLLHYRLAPADIPIAEILVAGG